MTACGMVLVRFRWHGMPFFPALQPVTSGPGLRLSGFPVMTVRLV